MDSDTRDTLDRFLDSKGLRRTTQRAVIVETAFGTDQHFTAEELWAMCRARDPRVSRATVYRTIPLLVESGLLREMDFGRPQKLYDPNYTKHPRHDHLICVDCDRIVEFEDRIIDQREVEVLRSLGFAATGKNVQIRGSCEQLKQTGACERRKAGPHVGPPI